MKLSELRKSLKQFEKEHGDRNVYFQDDFGDLFSPVCITGCSEDFAMIKCNYEAK